MTRGKSNTYTTRERSEAAKKGWRERKRLFWVTGGVKPINTVPTGRVGVPVNK